MSLQDELNAKKLVKGMETEAEQRKNEENMNVIKDKATDFYSGFYPWLQSTPHTPMEFTWKSWDSLIGIHKPFLLSNFIPLPETEAAYRSIKFSQPLYVSHMLGDKTDVFGAAVSFGGAGRSYPLLFVTLLFDRSLTFGLQSGSNSLMKWAEDVAQLKKILIETL
jgi:hypothetical protein